MADITLSIDMALYQKRVTNFAELVTVQGPCDKCNGSGQFSWVSNAEATQGQTLTGDCKRCAGKGFITNADVERNEAFAEYRVRQVEQARALIARAEAASA